MPVTLKDAKISVKLDLKDAEKSADSLEKRTKDTREEQKRQDKQERAKERASRPRGGRAGALAAGAVVGARGVAGRVGHAAAFALGFGAFIELVVPTITAAITEAAPELIKKTGIPDWIREKVNDAVQTIVSDRLAEISAAFGAVEATKELARAQIVLGQDPSGGELLDDLATEFKAKEAQNLAERERKKITRGLIGETIGKAASELWR